MIPLRPLPSLRPVRDRVFLALVCSLAVGVVYSGAVRGARAQPEGAEDAAPAKSSPGESEAAGRRAAAEVGPPDYGPQGVRDSFTLNEGQ